MKQIRSLSEFSCLSEYTRLYPNSLQVYCGNSSYNGLRQTDRLLGECLMISSLPGKASRTLFNIASLAERLKDEPGKLDIKRREFISLPNCFPLQLAIIS